MRNTYHWLLLETFQYYLQYLHLFTSTFNKIFINLLCYLLVFPCRSYEYGNDKNKAASSFLR